MQTIKNKILPLLTLLTLLILGGFTTEVWGQLPYNTTMTSTHYNDSKVKVGSDGESYSQNAWSSGIFLQAGTRKSLFGSIKGEEWNWEDKYVIIALKTNSIPYQLKFKYKCSSIIASNPDWYVAESSDKSNWTTIWSTESNSTSTSALQTVDLSKSTKYIKFCYSGNYGGTYSDIKVTDQAYVHNPKVGDDEISSLDFGSGTISSGKAELSFEVEWCNVSALSVTSSNSTYFTVSPSSFGNTAKYGTQTVTVYYDRDVAVGNNHSGTITISNNNATYTKTVTVTGTTTKRPQEIHWNASLAAVNYTLNAEESLTGSAIATADKEDAVITYTSSNNSVVAVSPDGKTLSAVSTGTASITASATGDDVYAVGTDSKTFTVTAKKKQTITWNQNLMGLKTNANPNTVNLNATATSNGTITYSIETGSDACVTLGGTNNSVMTITGTPGTAYIKATQAGGIIGGEDWIAATAIKQVKVRDPNSSCDEYAISDESFTFSSGDKTSMSEKVFNLTGKPTTLTFKAKRGGLKFLWSEQKDLYIEQYANFGSGLEWKQLEAIQPGTSEGSYGPYALEETATKIRFRSGEYAEQQVYNITSARKTIFDVSETSITDDAERNVKWSKTISVTRSNIDVLDISVTSADASCPFQLSKTSLGTDCADMNTETFEVFFTPTTKNKTYTGTITITDSKAANTHIATIPLSITTVAFNQAITWNFTDNQEFETTHEPLVFNATTDATDLEVSYKIKEGDESLATLDGNTLTFTASGTLHVIAYQEGSDRYNAAPEIEKTLIITKVTPAIATNPTVATIKYLDNLVNGEGCQLSNGLATVTLRGEEDTPVAGTFTWKTTKQITDAAGEYEHPIVFTPTDGGMYNDTTFDMSVTISRADAFIEMKNSEVLVTVEDLYQVDLDTLLISQTVDAISANRAGNVSYKVFSDNKENATIDDNNLFSATACGTYTLVATKAQTSYYAEATDTFTIEVGKLTPVITGNNTEMMVDAVQENAFYFHDVDGQVAHITIKSIADVRNGDNVIEYDADHNRIIACNAGEATIYFTQEETSTLKGGTSGTYTYTIHKYNSSFASARDTAVLVDEDATLAYTLSYTKPNDAYIGTNHSANDVPTENSGNFFYTLTQNISTDITTGSDDPNLAVAFNPSTKTVTGKNQGVGIIAFKQKETYKYNETKDTIYVSVSKRDNELTNSWNVWEKTLGNNSSQDITFTTTNKNYARSPLTINQTYGEESATISNLSGTMYRINTTAVNGYATWFIRQAEDYKYLAVEADVMVMMGVPNPPTCYIIEDNTTHSFSTHINDWEGHFDNPIVINAPVDKLWFTATRQVGGFNYFVAQYSVDNGYTWRTICNPSLEIFDKDFGPYSFTGLTTNEKVTHIRFGALQGATLTKWYKNIKVSRKAYLDIEDASHNTISTLEMPSTTISNSSSAKFYIDYSTCDDEIYIESNNPHFTLSKTSFAADGDNFDQPKEEITVTYSNSVQSKDTAIISVYTNYQRRVLRVTAETNRRTQTLEWQDGYTTNPITLPVGWTLTAPKVAATASSGNTVTYSSSDETIVRIIGGGSGFEVVGEGSATITAHAEGNETWEPVSEERDVVATIKIIQEIGWEQTFPRFMEIGEKISLDAKVFLLNLSTGEKTYSADRTAELKYTSANSSIVSVANNVMTVNGYGSTTIRAEVSEHEDYEKAVPVNMLIVVRQPSTGCETPLVFEFPQVDTLFLLDYDFSNWQTPELISPEFEINPANGVPDKLSFQHSGAEFIAPVIHTHHYTGYIKVQQRVGATWTDVPESRVAPTMNEWNELNNLQLDENANRIRFIREANGEGYHFFKDVRITLRQYMRVDKPAINFGDVKVGETRNESIELDYSDLKGDVSATRTAEDDWLTLANGGAMNIECGSHGQYSLPITFVPKQKGEWKDTIVVFDNIANIELRIPLQANVLASDLFIFEVAGEWGIDSNWNKNSVPALNADVSIGADVTITSEVIINSLVIQEGKKVTIMPNGGLTVGAGGIIGADKTNLTLKADTASKSETKGKTGYLRISPAYKGEMPEATVELFSKAYYDPNSTDKNNTASWQYVGIPVETEELAKTFFANSRIYSWNESSGEWINDRKTLVMKPFIGYCTSQYRDENGMLVIFKGKLVNRRDQEVLELSYTPTSAEPGLNVFANSYSAPIDITKIDSKDFNIGDDDDATIHLFNTGSRIDINNQEGVELNSESVDAAGQYISIPVGSANDMKKLFNCPTVIAPMQGFFVNTTKNGGTLTLRYEDVVWKPSPANTPMRSRRNADSEEDELVSSGAMKVTMSSNGWKDRVYLLESEQYSTSFEKGIDARKLESGDLNIFVVTDGKRLAVNATNSINNTYIGVRTGEEMYYTMVFTNLYGDTEWSLLDTETNEMTNIEEGSEYSFYAEPNTEIESRFIIVERAQVPSTPTDINGAEDGVKVQKFIKENQMYILKNGILYNAQGKVVR